MLSLFVVSSALAVVDADPELLGIYFDQNADADCLPGALLYTALEMSVILTTPSAEFIGGFEIGSELSDPGNMMILTDVFGEGALEVGTAG